MALGNASFAVRERLRAPAILATAWFLSGPSQPGPGIELAGTRDGATTPKRRAILLTVSRLVERTRAHDMVIRALPMIRAKVRTSPT